MRILWEPGTLNSINAYCYARLYNGGLHFPLFSWELYTFIL